MVNRTKASFKDLVWEEAAAIAVVRNERWLKAVYRYAVVVREPTIVHPLVSIRNGKWGIRKRVALPGDYVTLKRLIIKPQLNGTVACIV